MNPYDFVATLADPTSTEPVSGTGVLDGGTATDLPGLSTFKGLVMGLIPYALVACAAAFIIGAILWAVGSHSQNPHHATNGKKTLVVALAAALLIGASAYLVGWFNERGKSVAAPAAPYSAYPSVDTHSF